MLIELGSMVIDAGMIVSVWPAANGNPGTVVRYRDPRAHATSELEQIGWYVADVPYDAVLAVLRDAGVLRVARNPQAPAITPAGHETAAPNTDRHREGAPDVAS